MYLDKFWGGLTKECFREKHCFLRKGYRNMGVWRYWWKSYSSTFSPLKMPWIWLYPLYALKSWFFSLKSFVLEFGVYRRICSFAGCSSHPIRKKYFLNPDWYIEWMGTVHRWLGRRSTVNGQNSMHSHIVGIFRWRRKEPFLGNKKENGIFRWHRKNAVSSQSY